MHIDDFIDNHKTDPDVSYFFFMKRLPASLQYKFKHIIDDLELYCDYNEKRYRVTGASRMGDIWLNKDLEKTTGYTERVDIDDCINFSKNKKE